MTHGPEPEAPHIPVHLQQGGGCQILVQKYDQAPLANRQTTPGDTSSKMPSGTLAYRPINPSLPSPGLGVFFWSTKDLQTISEIRHFIRAEKNPFSSLQTVPRGRNIKSAIDIRPYFRAEPGKEVRTRPVCHGVEPTSSPMKCLALYCRVLQETMWHLRESLVEKGLCQHQMTSGWATPGV